MHSVLIQGAATQPWWLRNDAAEVSVEPAIHYQDGLPRRTHQIVLHSIVPSHAGGRVRWKLARADAG